ncbi:MAG: hypothetical protein ACE366_01765 [Bradymonadia bacterium]
MRMNLKTLGTLALAAGACLLSASGAWAQDDGSGEACADVVEMSPTRTLRQLSLDLWGRVPTAEEYAAVVDADFDDEALDALVGEMLDAPEFENFVNRYHLDLLWPNIQGLELVNGGIAYLLPASFYEGGISGDYTTERMFSLLTGLYARGGLVPCADEPAEFDENGAPVMEPWPDGTMREGYVWVEPYWAPGTEVKVCALEAREAAVGNNGLACNTLNGLGSGGCGCGPQLQHCMSIDAANMIQPSIRGQMMAMVQEIIQSDRPYTDVLTDKVEMINGPLVHYYRYLAQMAVDPFIQSPQVLMEDLPELEFNDTEWQAVDRPEPHAGVLTSMAFLLRFQTNRARANRFYTAFLCEPFQAPPDGLPSPNDECSQEPDLRKRCGCNYCHSALEPAAGYWGQFAEAGTYLMTRDEFPIYSARCAACAETGQCDFICERFYVTEAGHPDEEPFLGVLKSYQWRGETEASYVEQGPSGLVQRALDNGQLARCAVDNLFNRLYRRPMTDAERRERLPELAQAFIDSDYSFKALVRSLVTDAAYGRMAR